MTVYQRHTDLNPPVYQVCVCFIRMGCGALDYRQQAQQMELRTGGMSVSTQVIPDSTQLDMYEQVGGSSACVASRATQEIVESIVDLQMVQFDSLLAAQCMLGEAAAF